MEKLSDNELKSIIDDVWEVNATEREIAADLLSTRQRLEQAEADNKSLRHIIEAWKADKDIRHELSALREQTRWIPVSERLPERGDYIIMILKNANIPGVAHVLNPKLQARFITHWMPLPQPPEGGQK